MSLTKKSALICIVVILLGACLSLLAEACTDEQQVDYLLLSMTWQPGSCKSGKVKCKSYSNVFSIHGLWPQNKNQNLQFCCTKEFYSERKIQSIKGSLRDSWPALRDGREDSSWEYQFNKHGSCAIGKVAGATTLVDYFSKAIGEFKKFNLAKVLQEEGGFKIRTSSVYYGSDILAYLKEHFGHQFQLTCEPMGQSKAVTEIRACYDSRFKQIDCGYTRKICKGPVTFQ